MHLDNIPPHHNQIRGHISGSTDHGLRFDIEVSSKPMRLTYGRARRVTDIQSRSAGHKPLIAQEGFRRIFNISTEEGAEEVPIIVLRIAEPDGRKIHRIWIDVSPDGFYWANGESSINLRHLVRELASTIEASCGLVSRGMRM